ncbi:Putative metabolite transport protein YwtG [Vanrija pseudolonga]|uniref:Metabolite transport protein YwtG n=1 Tax=Vanrija pseudolonga TaxID=143232 RepID=A0AAF0YGM1_9TREE|nr:Putative metabolite transport protein YwtG [Vanrija pseudolonga]
MSHGHGWKNQSTFPLTAAMTEGKPFQQQVETPAAGEGSGPTAAPDSINETIIQTKKKRGEAANPLADLSTDEVLAHAQAFAEANNLPVDLLRKGALVAKSPTEYEHLSILSDEDKFELRREKERKFWQPKTFYNLVIACSVAAAVQGMDESVISGAQLFYPKQLGIDGAESERNRWLNGLVNAAPYLCCGVLGCWLTDPLNKFFGRRGTIMFCSVVSIICCIWQACTNTWWHLLIARFVLGIGIGPNSSTVPIFSAECAPAPIRGALVMQWQVWTAFGIMLGYVADLAFFHVPSKPHITGLNWRLMLAAPLLPALVVLIQMPFLPESPRWLMSKGKYEKAYRAMLRLRGSEVIAARDIYYIFILQQETESTTRHGNRFVELFTVLRNRRATLGSLLLMFGQQFCGINAIVYYTATIFTNAGFSEISALLASWGFGMTNCIFAIPAILTIDKFGRRPLLLSTFPVMAIMLLFVGFCFWIPEDSKARIALIATGIYIYTAFYSSGEGPVPFTYSAEVYPLYVREIGMSLATSVTWTFNFIVGLTFPPMLEAFKPQGTFAWYACWCAILFVCVLLFLPESKGLTLEELDQVFSVPTGVHAKYQLWNLGWHFRHYILRRKEPHQSLWEYGGDDADSAIFQDKPTNQVSTA